MGAGTPAATARSVHRARSASSLARSTTPTACARFQCPMARAAVLGAVLDGCRAEVARLVDG